MTNFPNDPFGSQPNYANTGSIYVQPGMGGGGFEPARTSKLAILALIIGILGFLICWFPVVGPIIGFLAVLTGIGAFISIGGSHGRKKGKGLAVAGVIMGLVNVAIGVSCVVGMGMAGGVIQQQSKIFDAAQAGDIDAFNGYTTGNAQLTKGELDAFVASYQPAMGGFKEAPKSFMQIFKAISVPAAMEEMNSIQQAHMGKPMQAIPVLWTFDKGDATVIMLLDQTGKSNTKPLGLVEDIIIVDKASNSVVTRLSDVLANSTPGATPDAAPAAPDAPADAPADATPDAPAPAEGEQAP